ncbi:hypothetical protein [Streptomyces sp. JW3]|uniref:hypothetical protein n=1 Tax=Streptomyces sp. JW3 TaxID=3456955 RepID=UPI003FA4D293
MLLLAALFAVLQLANVTGRDTPDTKNYLSYALSLSGEGKRGAAAGAIEHYCASRASSAKRAQSVHVVHFHRADPTARVTAGCREREWRNVERRLRAGQTGGHTVPFMPERFMRIFEVRPGYPAFLVPFVTALGVTWGVWTASVLVAAAGGVLVFLILRTLAVSAPLALTGQALYYVLPCGTVAMRPMTEGLLMALTLTVVWGCALVLRERPQRWGYWLVAGSLALLFTVKHSQALFLGGCLAAAGTAIALRRARRGEGWGWGVGWGESWGASRGGGRGARRGEDPGENPGGDRGENRGENRGESQDARWGESQDARWGGDRNARRSGERDSAEVVLRLAGIGLGAALATVLLARLLHYPSESESLQDLLAHHFARPDRQRPWPEFLQLQGNFWTEWSRRQLREPLFVAALAAGACGALRRPAFGAFLVAAAATGILTQAGHPDINIWGGRLIVLAWLLPVVGLPLLLEPVVRGRVPLPAQGHADRAVRTTS